MQPMNIIYIHSHDTGRYIQPYGYAVDTPNLQKLAEGGVLFRHAFCAAPTCSPSRAALLTGQSPHSVGMLGLSHRGHKLNDYNDHIVHTLKSNGYVCAIAGTHHVSPKGVPVDQAVGYDRVLSPANDEPAADAARAFIGEAHDQPFFLAVGFGRTHRTGTNEHGVQWHNGDESPTGDPRYVRPPVPLPDTPETRADFADYRVCASRLDQMMGRVFDAVDEAGLADQTLIIATTDHGVAFPGCKCHLTDHGMGVMLILRGPSGAGLTGGKVVDGMVSHIDLFPTVCELTGIAPPDRLEGRSIMPLVRGDADEVNDEVFSEVTHHAAYEPKRAVRTRRWKYIRRFDEEYDRTVLSNIDPSVSKDMWAEHGWGDRQPPKESLFDLMFDPNEACTLAGSPEHVAVLDEMRGRLAAWQQRTNDPILNGSLAEMPGLTVTKRDVYAPAGEKVTYPAE